MRRTPWTCIVVTAFGALLLTACNRASSASESRATSGAKTEGAAMGSALVGKPAPEFELSDLEGHKVKLSQFRGKTVVLEWFNPECPFVRASHTKGSLKGLAAKYTDKGIVWIAINYGAPGKQGYGVEANVAGTHKYGLTHPVLLDETGEVGRAYDARHTPHMFVIDGKGVLVYRGAIDNSPDGEGEPPATCTPLDLVAAAPPERAFCRLVVAPQ